MVEHVETYRTQTPLVSVSRRDALNLVSGEHVSFKGISSPKLHPAEITWPLLGSDIRNTRNGIIIFDGVLCNEHEESQNMSPPFNWESFDLLTPIHKVTSWIRKRLKHCRSRDKL